MNRKFDKKQVKEQSTSQQWHAPTADIPGYKAIKDPQANNNRLPKIRGIYPSSYLPLVCEMLYVIQVQGMVIHSSCSPAEHGCGWCFHMLANLLNRPCQIAFFRLDETLVSERFVHTARHLIPVKVWLTNISSGRPTYLYLTMPVWLPFCQPFSQSLFF